MVNSSHGLAVRWARKWLAQFKAAFATRRLLLPDCKDTPFAKVLEQKPYRFCEAALK